MIDSTSIVYISGPMTGLPDFNRIAFHRAEQFISEHYGNPKIINPADVPPDWTWEKAMEKDIKDINNGITHIVLLPGWENSKGSKIELSIAIMKFPDVSVLLWYDKMDDID